MCDAFISFRFADQKMAEYIVNQLSVKYGIQCWICSRDSSHGAQFRLEIPKIIRSVSVVVFLQSANANGSQEIASELDMAFTGGKVIIPFRLDHEETDYEYYTSGRDYIDGTKPTLEQRIRELAESISRITGKPLAVCGEEALEGAGDAEKTLLSVKPDCEDIFLGREALMEEIHSAFEDDRNVLFLHGMGGIGKSQLAGQYYRRHRVFYTTVVFGKYEGSLAALIADDTVFRIKGMSRRIREDNTPQTDEEYAREKLAFLKRTADEHTLIILDNYDVESDPFFEDLTEKAEYRVLVTSRIRPERGRYHRIAVKELDDETLRDLFIEFADPEEEEICRDDPAFPELFAYTNRHTLTLTLIAKYMAEKSIDDIGEMLGKLKAQSLSVISDSRRADGFARVRDILRMASLNEDEKMFLRCLALMPLSGVKQEFFKRWCGDVFAARNYLANNLGLVIVNREQGTLALHPVIREVVLEEIEFDYTKYQAFIETFAGELLDYIAWNYPVQIKNMYFECSKGILEAFGEINRTNFNSCFHMINFCCFVDGYENNLRRLGTILEAAEKIFGRSAPETARILHRIGWCHYARGNYETAENFLTEEAYPLLEKYYDEVPGEYIHCCCDIAKLSFRKYLQDNTHPEYKDCAEQLMQRALDTIHNSELKTKFEVVRYRSIMVYTTLSAHQSALGNQEQALLYCDKAMQNATVLDNTYLDQAALLFIEEKIHRLMSNYEVASEKIKRSIGLMEQYSGMRNSASSHGERYCTLYSDLAECYEHLDNPLLARETWQKAYDIAEQILTEQHPVRENIRANLERYIG